MNIITLYPEILILISTLFLSFYYTLLKKFTDHIMILYFWLHILSYGAFSLIFLYRQESFKLNGTALKSLIMDTSYINLPLYALSSVFLVVIYIILDRLLKKYSVPTILALSQVSIILSTTGYIILGDNVSTMSIIGVCIIFCGAIISGLRNVKMINPLKAFMEYDKNLIKLSIVKAFLYTATILITYICTVTYNLTTRNILLLLTKHLHMIPFVAISPIQFNIGVQFSNVIAMFIYIRYFRGTSNLIPKMIHTHRNLILQLSILYILQAFFYYEAFNLIQNKNLITALSKLYLPITLLLSYQFFKEKISKEQIVGMCIITIGSFISLM